VDERHRLEKRIEEHFSDSRPGLNKLFTFFDLLRQSVYSRVAGYEDLNDAEQLAADPTFRFINLQRIWDEGATLPRLCIASRLDYWPSRKSDRTMSLNRETLAQSESLNGLGCVLLEIDSSESPVHGRQVGSDYNGYFQSVCYHPLFLFKS